MVLFTVHTDTDDDDDDDDNDDDDVLIFLSSRHIRWAPIYIYTAGSMCLVPTIASASPQLVIMRWLT